MLCIFSIEASSNFLEEDALQALIEQENIAMQQLAEQAAAEQAAAEQAAAVKTTDKESTEVVSAPLDKVNNSDNLILMSHSQALCSSLDKKQPVNSGMPSEYFSTEDDGIVKQSSLREFFKITNNQYNSNCDGWFRKYLSTHFNKALVFAYDPKNFIGIISYWGFSNGSFEKNANHHALQSCEESIDKIESHVCSILFSNNKIVNKNYLKLLKVSIEK
jgi:hypothetical protein